MVVPILFLTGSVLSAQDPLARVIRVPPAMGSEDFAYFANEVPGFFYRLGQVKPGTTSGDHHTPTFLADDSSIPVGIKAMSFVIVDYLTRHK
jgi:amidohydrolase